MPLGFTRDHLPLKGHEYQGVSDFASVNVALEMGANALKALRGQPDFFRLYGHHASYGSRERQS